MIFTLRGPNQQALYSWIKANRPDLSAEFEPLYMRQVRVRLNAITGLDIGPNELIEKGSAKYLEALKQQPD